MTKMKTHSMLLLGLLGWVAQAVATTPTNPNILFIAADALRPQPGGYGEKQIVSPNLASAPALNSSAPIEGVTVETGGEKLEAIVETPAQRDARMKWWREAKFGLFIHWGVYAVRAGQRRQQTDSHCC